jgi:hypothetical protein
MQISDSIRSWGVRITVLAAGLLTHGLAMASEEFPAAIQEAANMPCVPSCTLCHGIDPGTATTFASKKLGATLVTYGGNFVKAHDTAALKANYAAYKVTPDGAAVDAQLAQGIDPETKTDLCSSENKLAYGCGAHVAAKAPPSDATALMWIAGAMAVGAFVRRARVRR